MHCQPLSLLHNRTGSFNDYTKLIILCHMVPLALDKHIVYYYPASEILSHVKPSFLAA